MYRWKHTTKDSIYEAGFTGDYGPRNITRLLDVVEGMNGRTWLAAKMGLEGLRPVKLYHSWRKSNGTEGWTKKVESWRIDGVVNSGMDRWRIGQTT